jgi:drug/metabolite transporter (DMT)-like permease
MLAKGCRAWHGRLMNGASKPPGWIAAAPLTFVFLWATGFVVARLSAGHVGPFTFLTLRFPIAALLMLAIAFLQRAAWPSVPDGLHAAAVGAFLHGGYLAPIYWAVAHGMPGGVSALIVGLQPLMTAFLAAFVLGELISWRHAAGLVVGIAGVALVVWPKLEAGFTGGITLATTAACIFGAASAALGTVYQKRFASHIPLATGGVWQYAGASAVVILCLTLFEDFSFDGSASAWIALAWSVIVMSLGAIALLMLLIRHGEVARVSGLIFLVPAVAALMTFVLFNERLVPIQLLGMAVCAAAVLMVTRKSFRPSSSPA